VINGAFDTIVGIGGDGGRHSRAAIGAAAVPLGSCVEVEPLLEVAAPRRRRARK
jgi:enamine deaminase RidA (YjgF/YER057c/UK114 family)